MNTTEIDDETTILLTFVCATTACLDGGQKEPGIMDLASSPHLRQKTCKDLTYRLPAGEHLATEAIGPLS